MSENYIPVGQYRGALDKSAVLAEFDASQDEEEAQASIDNFMKTKKSSGKHKKRKLTSSSSLSLKRHHSESSSKKSHKSSATKPTIPKNIISLSDSEEEPSDVIEEAFSGNVITPGQRVELLNPMLAASIQQIEQANQQLNQLRQLTNSMTDTTPTKSNQTKRSDSVKFSFKPMDFNYKTIQFECFKDSPFTTAINDYARRASISADKITLELDGIPIEPNQTPLDHDLIDGIEIEVYAKKKDRHSAPKFNSIDVGEDLGSLPLALSQEPSQTQTQTQSDRPPEDFVKLKVRLSTSDKNTKPMGFKILKDDPMSKLIEGVAARANLSKTSFKLMFDGEITSGTEQYAELSVYSNLEIILSHDGSKQLAKKVWAYEKSEHSCDDYSPLLYPHSSRHKQMVVTFRGNFTANNQVLSHLLTFLSGKELLTLGLCNKEFYMLMKDQHIWQTLYMTEHGNSLITVVEGYSWKSRYKRVVEWQWNQQQCSADLTITPNGMTVLRSSIRGDSPTCQAIQNFTARRNTFQVFVERLGPWISFGISSRKIILDNASVVGAQSHLINVAMYHKGGALTVALIIVPHHRLTSSANGKVEIRHNGESDVIKVKSPIKEGTRVMVRVWKGTVYFYNRGREVASLPIPGRETETEDERTFYPTVSLSCGTVVTIQPKFNFEGNEKK
ncbi:hypothetical protein PROFUN_00045 [Planoprotostelium fungivorum]|uniref:Rad60/SUMO-like domain-containing protein n=1 Tax=Planoprotostelium fungivorum TaxID=1890364 RepID=A0A2P6P0G6_9EUKA|nr:hypothetical protein PROFUN_00045 [Planoprotostelium fungivorum]